MIKQQITQHGFIYRLQENDFTRQDNLYCLQIPKYLDVAFSLENKMIIPNKTTYQEEYKIIYFEIIRINDYMKMYINIPLQGNQGKTFYIQLNNIPNAMTMFHTDNQFYNKIRPRKQNKNQIYDYEISQDTSYIQIKLADFIAYHIEPSKISKKIFLPSKNTDLQKIYNEIKCDELDEEKKYSPPSYLQLQLLDKNKEIIIQVKNEIIKGGWTPLQQGQEISHYEQGYGYEYGRIIKNNNTVLVYCNTLDKYSDDIYFIFLWKLSTEQMTQLKQKKNELYYKMRYAVKTINNKYPVWRGWSPEITFTINIPPPTPTNLYMTAN